MEINKSCDAHYMGRLLGAFSIDALSLFAAALLLLLVIGSLTQTFRPGPAGVAATEVLAILLPALLWSQRRRSLVLAQVFGGGGPAASAWAVVGGLLLGAGWFYVVGVGLEPLMERVFPVSPQERAHMLRLLLPPGGPRPLWVDLLCLAGAPALCEEVLFRGVLLRTLLPRIALPAGWQQRAALLSLLGSSLLFGIFHLSWAKLLPTSVLGLGFGAAVLWKGSLWPAIAMHFANNTIVILLVRAGLEEPPAPSGNGFLWLLGAALCGATGLLLLRRVSRTSSTPERPREPGAAEVTGLTATTDQELIC